MYMYVYDVCTRVSSFFSLSSASTFLSILLLLCVSLSPSPRDHPPFLLSLELVPEEDEVEAAEVEVEHYCGGVPRRRRKKEEKASFSLFRSFSLFFLLHEKEEEERGKNVATRGRRLRRWPPTIHPSIHPTGSQQRAIFHFFLSLFLSLGAMLHNAKSERTLREANRKGPVGPPVRWPRPPPRFAVSIQNEPRATGGSRERVVCLSFLSSFSAKYIGASHTMHPRPKKTTERERERKNPSEQSVVHFLNNPFLSFRLVSPPPACQSLKKQP